MGTPPTLDAWMQALDRIVFAPPVWGTAVDRTTVPLATKPLVVALALLGAVKDEPRNPYTHTIG